MHLQESGEMYLETIYRLSREHEYVRSIDVAEEMGYMPPKSLSEKPPFIGEEETRTAIYGLSMLIANAARDEAALSFSDIYNRRLSARKNRTERVKEKLFLGEDL